MPSVSFYRPARRPRVLPVVKTVCCNCREVVEQGPPGAPISHGLCRACYRRAIWSMGKRPRDRDACPCCGAPGDVLEWPARAGMAVLQLE